MTLMSLRSRSRVKASTISMRDDKFIYTLYNISSKYYCKTYRYTHSEVQTLSDKEYILN